MESWVVARKLLPVPVLFLALTSCCCGGGQAVAPPAPNRLALLLVVDKSGSMAGESIELIKEACVKAGKALSEKDAIAVIAFDVRPRWILPFTPGNRNDLIESSVKRLYADGGCHILPALVEARRGFQTDERAKGCAVKHVILFSDGVCVSADFQSIVSRMAEEGITMSTVCIASSDGFDAPLMSRIAQWGHGRFFFTESMKKVPNLFGQESYRVLTNSRLEEATKLLAEADRLWGTDSDSAIKLYKRLLSEFGEAVVALNARTKVERRAQQGDE